MTKRNLMNERKKIYDIGKFIIGKFIIFAALMLPINAMAANPGELDFSFGTDGKVTTDIISAKNDVARASTLQSDGKILVAGETNNSTVTVFSLVRYNLNGSLDSTFGAGGKVTTEIIDGFSYVTAVAVQSDGKIVVAGYVENGRSYDDFALIRYESNGSLDISFGSNGKVITDIGNGNDQIQGMILQPNGKILVSGKSGVGDFADVVIARYESNGVLDSSFGVNGVVITTLVSGDDFANDLLLQPDGKIVIAGSVFNGSNLDFLIARYGTNGELDNTFGLGGVVTTDFAATDDVATSLAIQTDGKLLVGGSTGGYFFFNFALARYNSDGSLDNAFSEDGKTTTRISILDSINDISILRSGMIVVAGSSYNTSDEDITIAQYNTTGSLNTTFGSGGIIKTSIGASDDSVNSMNIQTDGKIVVAGMSNNGTNDDFAVVRYWGDLSPTAASVIISGRVKTSNGRGINRVRVLLTGGNGETHYALTNSFGFYRFIEVAAGETYIIQPVHKRYHFTPQVINVLSEINDLNFISEP